MAEDQKTDEQEEDLEVEEKGQEGQEDEQEDTQSDEDKGDEGKEDDEIPVRKTAKDYIIARKNKQIEKLKKGESGEEGEEEEDDSDKIEKEVKRHFEPLQETIKKDIDERELQGVLSKYEDASRYEKKLRRMMDVYTTVPVEGLYFMLRGKGGTGEQREQAKNEAKGTSLGGRTRRPNESAGKLPDFSQMTDEEFAEWEKKNNRPR